MLNEELEQLEISEFKIKNRLVNLCKFWGGELILGNNIENHYIIVKHSCPFQMGLGINHSKKIISCRHDISINTGAIIHEMGHVFASRLSPDDSDEWSFFGWEWAVAKKVGLLLKNFILQNKEYLVYKPSNSSFNKLVSFGNLSVSDRRKLLKTATELSIKKKLIVNGQPVSIR